MVSIIHRGKWCLTMVVMIVRGNCGGSLVGQMKQKERFGQDKLSLNNLLKSVGMRVIIDYNKLVERLFAYMDLVRRFEGEKLFLLVNLRSFVSLEDMELFMQTVVAHGLRVLLVDNQAYPLLSLEKRHIIDSDLCEI